MMPSSLSLSAACPLSARVFSDYDFPPGLAHKWKKPWLQPRSEDPQTWVTKARPILKYARAYQRVELSSGHAQTYPENAPDTLLLGGEVLVLDVALLPEPTVHASYAGSAAEGRHCPVMDAFFSRLVSDVSKGSDGGKRYEMG